MGIVVGAWLCVQSLAAQGIRFEQGTFEAAQARAAQEHKMLLLVVCADWLEACEILQQDIFTDAAVGKVYNAQFVCWQLDAKLIEESPYFAGVRIMNIPEYIFFDAGGNPQYRDKKLKDVDEMVAMAHAAANPENHLARLEARYQKGEREPAFLRRYIVEMNAIGKDMTAASRAYLDKLNREELLLTDNWIIATIGVQQISDGEFQYVLGHKASFQQQYGDQPVNDFIVGVYRNTLTEAVTRQDARLLGECQAVVRQLLGAAEAKPVILQDELTYSAAGGNWKTYAEKARELFASYALEDAQIYNDVAWNLFQHSDDPATLTLAVQWAQRSADLQPAYWNWHTVASLHHKLGKPEAALAAAQAAQQFVAPGSPEAAEVDALIHAIQK